MNQSREQVIMDFEYFQIQKWVLKPLERKKLDVKMGPFV